MPKYSFVIPCKNGLPYITSCINSILDQGFRDCEIVVSDNHSIDGTVQVLEEVFGHDARVRVISPTKPLSMSRNFEHAISASQGDWISTLGADDGILPYFFEEMENLTQLLPDAEAFVSKRAYFYWEGCEESYGNRSVLFERNMTLKRGDSRKDSLRVLRGKMLYNETLQLYAGSVVHKSLIEKVRGRDPDGKLFRSSQPDIYSAWALLACEPQYYVIGSPLHWIGSSPASNGFLQAASVKSDKANEFWLSSAGQDEPISGLLDFGSETPVHLMLMDAALKVDANSHRPNRSAIISHGFVGALVNEQYKHWETVRQSVRKTGNMYSWILAQGLGIRVTNHVKRAVKAALRELRVKIKSRDVVSLRRHQSGEVDCIEKANSLLAPSSERN